MRFYPIGAAWTAWIGLMLVAATGFSAEPAPGDLPAMARAAKGHFRPIGQHDLDRAKTRVQATAARLTTRLASAGPEAADWRAFLQFDAFVAELRKAQPALPVLEKTYTRLASGQDGLNLIWFAELRQALQSYLAAVQAKSDPKTPERHDAIVEGLAKRLAELPKAISAEEALAIGNALRWLDDTGQAAKLVAAVRKQCRQSNFLGQASEKLVGTGIARVVDEMTPIRDCILGTDIQGTGHTVGRVTVKLVPDKHMAVLDTCLAAKVDSQTVGYNGPAIIHSVGVTELLGVKRLWIDAEGIGAHPATSDADTCTTITCIGSTKDKAIVERIASRKAGKKKSQAEAIASQHAAWRLNDRMDQESTENLAQANERYVARFRKPLTDRNLFPEELLFSTCAKYLSVRAMESDAYHPGAPSAPPAPPANVDLAVRVHQSALNNLTDKALGGMTVSDETLQATLKDLLGKVPDEFKPDQREQPWAIHFAAGVPITFEFLNDNQFRITVRGRRFIRGENTYPAMDTTVLYKIVQAGGTIKCVRQGALQVFPPDFSKGDRLSGRQLVIRDLVARRFGKVFKEELVGKGIELKGKLEKGGRLMPVAMTSQAGWMTIAWNLVPQPAKTAQR